MSETTAPNEEKTLARAVLCYFVKVINGEAHVLLPIKAKKIGKGFRNGYGGGIEKNETPLRTTEREVLEESGGIIVKVDDLHYAAHCEFTTEKTDGGKFICTVHVYIAEKWTGEPKDTREMYDAQWFPIDNLPLEQLMPADKAWLHKVLSHNILGRNNAYSVKASYGPKQEYLLKPVEITELK